jgi:hypothetical protein
MNFFRIDLKKKRADQGFVHGAKDMS